MSCKARRSTIQTSLTYLCFFWTETRQQPPKIQLSSIAASQFLFDLYFALAIQFLLDKDSDPFLFPEFHASVQGKKKGDALDSKAATLWAKIYQRMMKIVNSFPGKYAYVFLFIY